MSGLSSGSQDRPIWPIVGIDLGTCYSCVAVWRDEHVEIISNDQGNRTTPSYVAFSDSGRLIGEAALSQASLNPVNTVYGTKRLIGLRSDDARVESDARYFPFDIFDKDGKPYIRVTYRGEQKELSPEEISAMVLSKMKHTAETYLQTTVSDAVITVPAYFNNAQREATKDAAAISGLRVRRVLSEPTAAALAYGLGRGTEMGSGEHTVIVFDLGGGTCDVSLLVLECNIFEVIAIAGTTHLGGEDFDNRLVEYFMNQFRDKHHKDLSTSPRAVRRLRTACERAKRTLSSATVASIEIESLFEGIDFFTTLTRARFEDLCHDLFQQTLTLVERVLQDSGRDKGEIEEIILSGGSTRIPRVAELLSEFFDGKEPKKGINPDEAVAAGAAIQAAILGGSQAEKLADLLLLDITPLSLGVRGTDDVMQTLIKRNTILPSLRLEDFTTFKDNQHEVDLWIYEGESPRASDNNLLGKYTLAPIPPSPAGVPHFTVRFSIDANGILKVSAFDATAPETAKYITVTNAEARLSENDIKRMTREAQQYQAEDDAQAARIASRNELEDLAFKLRDFMDTGIGVDNVIDNIAEIKATIDRTISWPERFPSATVKEYIEKLLELERLVNSDANVIPTGNSGKEIQAANTTPDGFSFPANSEHIGNIELELDNSSLEQRQESTIPFSEVVDQADVLMYDADENSNQVTFIDTLPLLCNIIREERLRIRLQNLGGDHAQVMIEYLHFVSNARLSVLLARTHELMQVAHTTEPSRYLPMAPKILPCPTLQVVQSYSALPALLYSKEVHSCQREQVAAGGFSDIYKGFFGGKELSVKAIRIYERGDTDKLLKEFAKEIVLWAYLQHENILPFYGAYYLSESRRRICLVSPWMRRGNIVDYMKRHALAPHSRALLIHEVCDVVAGLRYLHLQDMIHGDIKGANILVDERERACIMDFGLSRIRTDQTLINSLPSSSIKGYTPRYAAYEILNNNPPTFATDIWALGCVSYQIMTGNAPFPGIVKEEPVKIARAMLDGQRPIDPLPDPSNLSQEEIIIWEQIDSCCQKEVEQRPDCDHIFRKFESAGISRVDDDTRSAQEDAYWQRRVFWDAMKDGEEDPLDLSLVDSILRGLGN